MELKEALKKYGYAGVVTLILIGSLIFDGPIHECEGNVPPLRSCYKLSKSNRSCYHSTGRDLCSDGEWELIEHYDSQEKGNIERCTPQGCSSI